MEKWYPVIMQTNWPGEGFAREPQSGDFETQDQQSQEALSWAKEKVQMWHRTVEAQENETRKEYWRQYHLLAIFLVRQEENLRNFTEIRAVLYDDQAEIFQNDLESMLNQISVANFKNPSLLGLRIPCRNIPGFQEKNAANATPVFSNEPSHFGKTASLVCLSCLALVAIVYILYSVLSPAVKTVSILEVIIKQYEDNQESALSDSIQFAELSPIQGVKSDTSPSVVNPSDANHAEISDAGKEMQEKGKLNILEKIKKNGRWKEPLPSGTYRMICIKNPNYEWTEQTIRKLQDKSLVSDKLRQESEWKECLDLNPDIQVAFSLRRPYFNIRTMMVRIATDGREISVSEDYGKIELEPSKNRYAKGESVKVRFLSHPEDSVGVPYKIDKLKIDGEEQKDIIVQTTMHKDIQIVGVLKRTQQYESAIKSMETFLHKFQRWKETRSHPDEYPFYIESKTPDGKLEMKTVNLQEYAGNLKAQIYSPEGKCNIFWEDMAVTPETWKYQNEYLEKYGNRFAELRKNWKKPVSENEKQDDSKENGVQDAVLKGMTKTWIPQIQSFNTEKKDNNEKKVPVFWHELEEHLDGMKDKGWNARWNIEFTISGALDSFLNNRSVRTIQIVDREGHCEIVNPPSDVVNWIKHNKMTETAKSTPEEKNHNDRWYVGMSLNLALKKVLNLKEITLSFTPQSGTNASLTIFMPQNTGEMMEGQIYRSDGKTEKIWTKPLIQFYFAPEVLEKVTACIVHTLIQREEGKK